VLPRPHLLEPVSTASVARKVSRYAARETVISSSRPARLNAPAEGFLFCSTASERG
jgi:hypothetical protein